jgi:hypothetical protein
VSDPRCPSCGSPVASCACGWSGAVPRSELLGSAAAVVVGAVVLWLAYAVLA